LDLRDGQGLDEVQVRSLQDALFDFGELGFESLLLRAEFDAALFDVADEVLVGVVD
jgi:hypothetical protein